MIRNGSWRTPAPKAPSRLGLRGFPSGAPEGMRGVRAARGFDRVPNVDVECRSRCGADRPRPNPARGSLDGSHPPQALTGPACSARRRETPPDQGSPSVAQDPNTASRPAARCLAKPLGRTGWREDKRGQNGGDKSVRQPGQSGAKHGVGADFCENPLRVGNGLPACHKTGDWCDDVRYLRALQRDEIITMLCR